MNVQSLDGRCVVNLAVAPEPWLRWNRVIHTTTLKNVGEHDGLFRCRLHPSREKLAWQPHFDPGFEALEQQSRQMPNRWWGVSNSDDAARAATDMRQQLEAAGWNALDRLLDRESLLRAVSVGHEGLFPSLYPNDHGFVARAEALMLMDQGPGAALDDCLDRANGYPNASAFEMWVRQQALAAKAVRDVLG